jgi:signal transduction histidine kinase/ActR/RegA family two-component response regulator
LDLWGAIDRYASTAADDADAERWRGRFIATLCLLGALGSVLLGMLYVLTGAWLDASVTPVGAAFCLGLLWIWRKTKRASLIANTFGAFATLTYAAGFVVQRELSMVAWLVVVPLLTLFLGGRRLALAWFAIEAALIAAAVGLSMRWHAALPTNELLMAPALGRMLTLMVVVFVVGLVFDLSASSIMQRLREASETKTRFLANVSHELRTPLNGVLGMAELMSQNDLPPAQRDRLATIIQSGQHLRLLIDDVLDATQLERGTLQLSEGPVMAVDVVQTVIRQLQSLADSKRLSLAVEQPGPSLPLRTDALRLMQIVSNFVSNAIKFTEHGGITVVVQTTTVDEQVKLVIEVRDTGVGIAPHDLARLFTPFMRVGNTLNAPGTGLGLSIARTIAQLLGGTVTAHSSLGVGSTFRFEIVRPRATFPVERPMTPVAVQPGNAAPRVLLVDDNPVNLKVARGLLERLGCAVTTAADGEQALVQFEPKRFDLVLMDLHMPGMDGFECARNIRARCECIKIIALSATTAQAELDSVGTAGMNGFIAKPVRIEQLRDALPAQTPNRLETSPG